MEKGFNYYYEASLEPGKGLSWLHKELEREDLTELQMLSLQAAMESRKALGKIDWVSRWQDDSTEDWDFLGVNRDG